MDTDTTIYREEQRFRQFWILVVTLGVALIAWWSFVELVVLGDPGIAEWIFGLPTAFVSIGLIAVIAWARLITVVNPEGVSVVFVPFTSRLIPYSEIAAVESVRYRPLVEYGGWGVRRGMRGRIAYNVSGDQGVLLTLHSGRSVLIGSQRPDELVRAISAMLQQHRLREDVPVWQAGSASE